MEKQIDFMREATSCLDIQGGTSIAGTYIPSMGEKGITARKRGVWRERGVYEERPVYRSCVCRRRS